MRWVIRVALDSRAAVKKNAARRRVYIGATFNWHPDNSPKSVELQYIETRARYASGIGMAGGMRGQ